MKRVINTALSVIVLVLFLPTTLAIASWNSLPGTRLFAVKLAMEQALVFVTPSAKMKGDLQIHYTQRRFSEAQTLLAADHTSARGLVFLDNQVGATKQQILSASDPVVKRDLAKKYVETLQTVSTQLEEQKQIAVHNAQPQPTSMPARPTPTPRVPTPQPSIGIIPPSPPPGVPIHTPTNTPTRVPTNTPPPPAPQENLVQPPVPENIVASITASQEEIHQTIEEMQKISDEPEHDRNEKKDNEGNKENSQHADKKQE